MTIRAVFLDFYNTIVDFVPPRHERQAIACRERGIEVSPEQLRRAYVTAEDYWTEHNALRAIYSRSAEESQAFYAAYEQVLLAAAGVELSLEEAGEIYALYSQSERRLKLFDDVVPTLQRLRAGGCATALISNTDRDVTPLCEELGVAVWFDHIVSSALVGYEKPDVRIFEHTLRLVGCSPCEALHVGDQLKSDVAGAIAAGLGAVLLDRNGHLPDGSGYLRIDSLSRLTCSPNGLLS